MNQLILDRAYHKHVDEWLWDEWGYGRNWDIHFPEMILWYSTAGSARLDEKVAYTFLRKAKKGESLPKRPHRTWVDARKITKKICQNLKTNPVDYFTGGCGDIENGWRLLDEIHGIGPKIASFIMRDLSFMRDYSTGEGKASVVYRKKIDRSWFDTLTMEKQALFLPIDVHVYDGARRSRVGNSFQKHDVRDIQGDIDLYRAAATEIVLWARDRTFDPRDVNIYWYGVGAGVINTKGRKIKQS